MAPSALGCAAGGLEPNTRFFANGEEGHSSLGESLGEALHVATDAFEATADGAKFAEEAETAEAVEPAAEGLGYAFAAVAFNEANAAFGEGAAPGEGGGGGSGSSSSAASYGEPHEQTFSGASYAFQAAGEFTLAESTTDDLDIQVREQRFPGAADVALDTATAMRVGGNIVELAANSSGRLELWVDRKAVAYGSRALAGGGKISVESPQLATVTWPDGTAVSVFSGNTIAIAHEVVTCNSSDNINVMVKVAPSRSGHLEGLLGDPGEAYDQLVGGNGVVYSMDQLAFPSDSVQQLRRAVPPVRPELAHQPAELAFLLPEGPKHSHLHRPCLPEQGAHRSVAEPEDRRRRGEGLQSRRYYQLLLALRLRLRPGPHRWS